MNYYPFHIGDFRSGTANMSRLQRAIYRDLLDICYDTEQPLPLDMEELHYAVGAQSDEERRIVEHLLRFKFIKRDDGYHHEVCEKVIAEYHAKADIAKANGKLGGRPPKAKANPQKPSGLSVGTGSEPDRNPIATGSQANQEPITNNQEPELKVKPTVEGKPPTKRRSTDTPDGSLAVFEYWQQVMGHHNAKLDAKRVKAIKGRLKDGYSVEDLCRAVDGCKYDPFSQGANERQTVYDDIELICRDGPKVDKFRRIAGNGPPSGRSSNAQQTINNLQAYLEQHREN
ncbi:DUF1376 domain-containing protein [Massilia violaceinigra]|uniref:DUF1376 domain-containing protein n=1 Tax=Massilia violaceinigra TaxID=2045208 RepID=A0ABY4A1Y1_9BURK|nr:YdaU family protein [Massilia violaceinigra]UOD28761.1 DUF1376 domain-containing protein [Massilia violaceinigra]